MFLQWWPFWIGSLHENLRFHRWIGWHWCILPWRVHLHYDPLLIQTLRHLLDCSLELWKCLLFLTLLRLYNLRGSEGCIIFLLCSECLCHLFLLYTFLHIVHMCECLVNLPCGVFPFRSSFSVYQVLSSLVLVDLFGGETVDLSKFGWASASLVPN